MLGVYYDTSEAVGRFLVAETNEGVCAVLFGEPEDSMAELQDLFPEDEIFHKGISQHTNIAKWIDEGGVELSLPLDIRTGTPFQQEVWLEIMKIPRGETITYSELAAKIGKPTAYRAVATSCGRNILGGIIPCHRVVSKGGGTAGYRWGQELKRKLLDWEKKDE